MSKPSDFIKTFPMDSITQSWESERVALNIMVILSRTGDQFRELTWEEYKEEREKGDEFSGLEKRHFDGVIDYFKSADTVVLFSESWKDIYADTSS